MIRKVANGLVTFKLKNMEEVFPIYDEFAFGLNKDEFMSILKYVYHSTLIIYAAET